MKSENFCQECPKCGSTDKSIGKKRSGIEDEKTDTRYIQHIPSGSVGLIRCTQCGYIFEYCKDREMPVKIKKIRL